MRYFIEENRENGTLPEIMNAESGIAVTGEFLKKNADKSSCRIEMDEYGHEMAFFPLIEDKDFWESEIKQSEENR